MNKYIKHLVEGLFDDWDEIDSSGDAEVSSKLVYGPALEVVKDILYQAQFKYGYGWYNDPKYEKEICVEQVDDSIAFYLNFMDKGQKKRNYIKHLVLKEKYYSLETINKFFENLELMGVKYVMMTLTVEQDFYTKFEPEQVKSYKVNFRNIQFVSITANAISPINVTVNQKELVKSSLYRKLYMSDNQNDDTVNFSMNRSYYNDTINIESVSTIRLQATYNLKDYSFIKKIVNAFYLTPYGSNQVAKCNCLQGLPEGNYTVNITYRTDYQYNEYDDMPRQSLVGIPKNVEKINLTTEVEPCTILHKISFEGLTPEMQSKFNFIATRFPGNSHPLNIQFGPYKLQHKGRKWTPNKPHLTKILNLKDWFLDCYDKEPHEIYKAPENEETQKVLQAEQRKIDKANQEVQDKKDDMEKMIKNVKKHVKKGSLFYANYNRIYINDVTDTDIICTISNMHRITIGSNVPSSSRFNMSFSSFVKYIKMKPYYRVSQDETSETLYNLIVAPVEKSRERINNQRKKDAAEQRKAETAAKREAKKAEEKAKKAEAKKETKVLKIKRDEEKEPIKPEVKREIKKQIKQDSKIKIYDYSDKAIAVYGDTWTIKDKLKELGCKYNKFLNINGQKTPGWIVSNKKRAEIEDIIKNL